MSAWSRPAPSRRFRYSPLIAALACALPGAAWAQPAPVPTDIPVSTAAQFVTALGQVAGPTCDPNGSRIIASGPFTVSVATALPTIGCANVEIAGNNNIAIQDASYGGGLCGLNAAPTAGLTKVSGVTVRNFTYGGSGMCGKLEATANTVTANDKGFTLNGGAIVTGNTITANPVWGIADTGTGSTISQNTIDGNGYGIYAANAMVVDSNDITNNTNKGIYGLDSMVITSNTITGNGWNGVDVFDAATITGNLVANNGTGIDAGAGSVIKGNIVRDHMGEGTGINLYDGGTIGSSGPGEGNVVYNNYVDIYAYTGTAYGGALDIVNNLVGTPDGVAPGTSYYGINVYYQAAAYNITGNVIGSHSGGPGLRINYATAAGTISGNMVGVNASGTAALANQGSGIELYNLSGGVTLSGNVISGNTYSGVDIWQSSYLTLTNNKIGTNASGTAGIANGFGGVVANCAGALSFSGNVISSNGMYGGYFSGATDLTFTNNLIGTAADGISALGNTGPGISLNNVPCGTPLAVGADLDPKAAKVAIDNVFEGNVVAHNNGDGIFIWGNLSEGNFIRGGSIHSNTGKNINLDVYGGPAPIDTDPPDGTGGPNNRQNFPLITSAVEDSGYTVVDFTLNSIPNTPFDIQFYSNTTPGVYAGQTFVVPDGLTTVTTNASGIASGSMSLTGSRTNVTTTASGPYGTSEFSAPMAPLVPAALVLPASIAFGNVVVGATSPAQEVTFTSTGSGPYIVDSMVSAASPPSCPGSGVTICASGDFSCSTTCVPGTPYATTIPQTAACKITGAFHPMVTGPQTSTIYVCDNTSATARAIAFSGSGILMTLSAAPTSHDFGLVPFGTLALSPPIVITNPSGNPTALLSAPVVGAPFTVASTTCGSSLAPAASCAVTVGYAPGATTLQTGSLQLTVTNGNPISVPVYGTGSVPYAISPPLLDFGSQPLNVASLPLDFTLSNSSSNAIPLGATSLAAPFSISGTTCAGNSIPANGSCTLSAVFTPTLTGVVTGQLTVPVNLGGAPAMTAGLQGNGGTSSVLLPASVNLGTALVGGAELTAPVTMQNNGTLALAISSIFASTPFQATHACPSILAAGASCAITVKHLPTTVGTFTGTLTVLTDSPASPHTAALSATVQAVQGILTMPAGVDLGTAALASAVMQQPVLIQNTGNGNVDFTSIAVTPPFQLSHNCPASLAPSASCTANVTFDPVIYGNTTGQLTVQSSAAGGTRVATLLATVDRVTYGIGPGSADYGPVPVGSPSAPRTFIISNNGDRAIALAEVSTSGPFTLARHDCGTSIAARSSCSADVTFDPVQSGLASGALLARIGLAGAPPANAALTGTGTQQSALALPGAIDFGSVALGSVASLTQSLELRNTGNAVLTFTASITSGPFNLSSDCGLNLLPGQACTLVITFAPATVGEFQGSLAVVSNAPGGSRSINLVVRVQPRPAPVVRVSPAFIGYGERIVGTLSASQRVTITNEGGSDAALGPITAGVDFVVSSQCATSLAPSASCVVDVAMRPLRFGPRSSRLQFSSNAAGSPHIVELLGTGCRPFTMFSSRSGLRSNCSP